MKSVVQSFDAGGTCSHVGCHERVHSMPKIYAHSPLLHYVQFPKCTLDASRVDISDYEHGREMPQPSDETRVAGLAALEHYWLVSL